MYRKAFIATLLIIGMVLAMGGMAFAGGWNTIVAPASHDADAGLWGSDQSPHGGYTTTSNKCRTCHAVHMADPSGLGDPADATSWRLLRNDSRANECDYCHKPDSGLSAKQPYRTRSWTVRGEHTLGSTVVPDSDLGALTGGLSCGWCHSVHGADTLDTQDAIDAGLDGKILKRDPAGNGGDATVDTTRSAGSIPGGFDVVDGATLRTAFCSDCHSLNSNWDLDANDDTQTASSGVRPNSVSHVQGPAAEGQLEVYGAEKQVAAYAATGQTLPGCTTDPNQTGGCHNASSLGNLVTDNTNSAFPHQSKGGKLLFDGYTQDNASDPASNVDNGSRVMPQLDQVCIACHQNGGGTLGVGETF